LRSRLTQVIDVNYVWRRFSGFVEKYVERSELQ
jgi:hypothetical protein